MMSKLWLTRTQPAAFDSAAVWEKAGFEILVEPLLEIEPVLHDPVPEDSVIIFTSKNGIDHVECRGQRAICVGDATARKAKAAGYRDVVSVDGNSEDITTWVTENLPKTDLILHISGWHVRGRIIEDLLAGGYSAKRVKVYRSIQRKIWPTQVFSKVVFYSPLAAKTFTELARNMRKDLSEATAICISEATADELSDLALAQILIAKRPREDELIMAAKSA